MMRSLYSAVSGLKTHQTRMDVIGNNIANVNTEAFKSSSVTFQEIMYQTTASATSGNGATGLGGTNAKQIGLGVSAGSTSISIETAGAAETTGNPFDLKLSDAQSTNFFIVSDGNNTMFTRAGSFYVDGNGYLCMSSTGYTLQGWQVDETTGEIRKDLVSPLQVMSSDNQTSSPEATTKAYASGVLDKNDTNVTSSGGYVMTLGIYDDLGYSYTAKFAIKPVYKQETTTTTTYDVTWSDGSTSTSTTAVAVGDENPDDSTVTASVVTPNTSTTTSSTAIDGQYAITLTDIIDSDSNSILYESNGTTLKKDASGNTIDITKLFGTQIDADGDGTTDSDYGYIMTYDKNKGTFVNIGATGVSDDDETTNATKTVELTLAGLKTAFTTNVNDTTTDTNGDLINQQTSNFADITIDFSHTLNYDNSGTSTMKAVKGDTTGDGAGKKLGALTGITVNGDGKIYGSYDNGNTVLLCQIAAAQFSNASGLEKVGDNCYQTTLNSGEFDGIGVDISADGSSISTGELEMSNVDLSNEFTSMIVTQRGFQANSRVITTSDTLLEELINLKR